MSSVCGSLINACDWKRVFINEELETVVIGEKYVIKNLKQIIGKQQTKKGIPKIHTV